MGVVAITAHAPKDQKFFASFFQKRSAFFSPMSLRIIAGAWKGRKLIAPAGLETRPTNARARQAAFDMLMHASWAGGEWLRGARVLDVFAGTGAFGLEALSRGAAHAAFIEHAKPALAALRANIAACKAEAVSTIIPRDVLLAPPGSPHELVFLDPPYGQDLVAKALKILTAQNYLTPDSLIVAELGPEDSLHLTEIFAERAHGKARLVFGRI
jgi:16S rRNA (guanine966-N2)-methyltransferase